MRQLYYTLEAQLLPGWKLPHPKTLKVEQHTEHERGSNERTIAELTGGTSSLPVDPRRWKDPPHVALANLGYASDRRGGVASEKDIVWFTERYGPLGVEGGADTAALGEEPFWTKLEVFRWFQRNLREAWRKPDASLFLNPPGQDAKGMLGYDLMRITCEAKNGRLELRPMTCADYISILLTRDLAAGCAKVCQNPKCVSPYFVAKRRDAKFCSHPCAVLVNVIKFRQRQRCKRRKR